MKPQNKNDWTPEPFPEPRTIPEGWDASALSEKKISPDQNELAADWKPDPFPKPRIFPWRSDR